MEMKMAKILQTYDDKIFKILEEEAKKRGCSSVQELVRTVITPDWLKKEGLL
jgi:hypothetical protein